MSLAEQHCVPCGGEAEALNMTAAQKLLADMSGWKLSDDGKQISREWNFKNFIKALDFVNQVGVIAEAENHHPDIALGWGYVKITLMTHDLGGLHQNDFVVAAKINALG